MRRIAIIIGSDSDLPQCLLGLQYLQAAGQEGRASVEAVYTMSVHRNTAILLDELQYLSQKKRADVIIVGAGMANHLTGVCDAYLRYQLQDVLIPIIGVAFEGREPEQDIPAAVLSITRVPKTQVIFDDYVGADGFLRACKFAVEGRLPKIKLEEAKPHQERTLAQAIAAASTKAA